MTSYIAITDTETDPEAPLTATLAKKWRDNPIAIAEGDASVPANLRPTVFLGQINTTSGTSQTLSGLTLTPYKRLEFVIANVTTNTTPSLFYVVDATTPLNKISESYVLGESWSGMGRVDLATGVADFSVRLSWSGGDSTANSFVVLTPYFPTSTSVTFACTNAFTGGFIQVWGVK